MRSQYRSFAAISLLLVGLLGVNGSQAQTKRGVTPEDYFSFQFVSDPHISPDGKMIAFISYPKEVAADDHPYYKHVYLRLMPVTGGAPKIIAYVYGGQGTMNVPSWSRDGSKLAFVSNSDM